MVAVISFSTLYGSKWVATSSMFSAATSVGQVSVPSTGRSGLQPHTRNHARRKEFKFQYPLRVEVGCNRHAVLEHLRRSLVSVPSTGRSGLQLYKCPKRNKIQHGFSTLYGSKWVATSAGGVTYTPAVFSFSTLYGSKWVATRTSGRRATLSFMFQYPLRVEVGCNRKFWIALHKSGLFQYPLRVEVGCNFEPLFRRESVHKFQYPLRVEVGCNDCACAPT